MTAWEGDVVTIPCEAKGLPRPITFWIIEGNRDSLLFSACGQSNSSMFFLKNAKPDDSGRLICTAVNSAGSALQASYLKVLYNFLNHFL